MRIFGLLVIVTLSLLNSPGQAAASPDSRDWRIDASPSQRLGSILIRDPRDSEGFDIARVTAGRTDDRRLAAEVKFRNSYDEGAVFTVWNVYVNTDRDPNPEFVVISYPDNYSGQVFRSRGWDDLATGKPMSRCGGTVREGLRLGIDLDMACLGVTRSKKVAIVAQETYSVDEYDGSADDWAPGNKKWSKRF